MKILHLVPNYYPSIGGSQFMFQSFSEELKRQYADDVVIFTSNALYSSSASRNYFLAQGVSSINGVEVHRFRFNHLWPLLYRLCRRILNRFNLSMPLRDFFELLNAGPLSFQMFKAILNTHPDVICSAPGNYLNTFYPLLSRYLGNKTLFVICGMLHLKTNSMSKSVLWAIHQAEAYIALTAYERNFLIENGIDPQKIYIIGAGVDLKKFESYDGINIRQKYNVGDAPVIMFIGRHAQYKGMDTLLFAMQTVWSKYPDAFVLFVGSPTEYTATLKDIAQEFSSKEQAHIIFVEGFDEEEKPNYFAASDIFVSVSSQESFGIVYLEAWASRKPVIGGRIGAVESLISEGVDGLLVNCGSVPELSQSILTLLVDKELRFSMGQRGYEKVKQNFTWEIVTRKLHSVYDRVVQEHKAESQL